MSWLLIRLLQAGRTVCLSKFGGHPITFNPVHLDRNTRRPFNPLYCKDIHYHLLMEWEMITEDAYYLPSYHRESNHCCWQKTRSILIDIDSLCVWNCTGGIKHHSSKRYSFSRNSDYVGERCLNHCSKIYYVFNCAGDCEGSWYKHPMIIFLLIKPCSGFGLLPPGQTCFIKG